MTDPLTVACPDCTAPAGVECLHSNTSPVDGPHHNRERFARLRAVEHGTCALCGHPLVRGHHDTEGPDTVWHPDPQDAAACPVLPDPALDWNAYAAAVNAGVRPGFPAPAAFIPQGLPRPVEGGHDRTHDAAPPIPVLDVHADDPAAEAARYAAAVEDWRSQREDTQPRSTCPIHLGQVCVCDVEEGTQ